MRIRSINKTLKTKKMKLYLKLVFISLLSVFVACQSDETTEEIISEDKISDELASKIIATAASTNDLDLINFECNAIVYAHFLNYLGDHSDFFTINLSEQETQIDEELQNAYEATEIFFSKNDFVLDLVFPNGGLILSNKQAFIDYFEDCHIEEDFSFLPSEVDVSIPLSVKDINYHCQGYTSYFISESVMVEKGLTVAFETEEVSLSDGIQIIKEDFDAYVAQNSPQDESKSNNLDLTLDDLSIQYVKFTSPGGTTSFAKGKTQLLNYFEDCVLDRDPNDNDCINFVYPFKMDKINLQTEEIISITITGNEDLTPAFFDTSGNLTINYPINLISSEETIIQVNSNEELNTTLTNSSQYCDWEDEW